MKSVGNQSLPLRRIPAGAIIRLITTTSALAYLAARYGADQAAGASPAVAEAVDRMVGWFDRR